MSDDEFQYESDHDVAPTHSKLIEAVAQLDKGQRIKKPERSEPTIQVSEFHLVKSGISNRDVIRVEDLAKNLGEKGFHREISKKLEGNRKKTRVLRKPLEKLAAERIKRAVGFEKAQREVKRWSAVIERNRAADNLKFPLNRRPIKRKATTEFLQGFRVQSDLQKELAKLEPEKKEEEVEKPNNFALTMTEIREKRMEAAKFRAMQSYREAKAARQKKIKSKKFHRVQKKEKMKTQLKEFEQLQNVNPEAALEKLELLDKNRALERMSLRHKSTGQWARNKQIRAKYDKDTRQELAEQLSISRDLTQKIKRSGDSDDDNADENVPVSLSATDKENPWINGVKTQSEIDEFVSGYRKYWDQKHKEQEERQATKTIVKTVVSVNKAAHENQNDDENEETEEPDSHQKVKRCWMPSTFNPVTEVVTEYVNNTVHSNSNRNVDGLKDAKRNSDKQINQAKITKKKEKRVSFATDVDEREVKQKENDGRDKKLDSSTKSNVEQSKNKKDATVEINKLKSVQPMNKNETECVQNSAKEERSNSKKKDKAAKRVSKKDVGTSAWAVEAVDTSTEINESLNDTNEPSMEAIESNIEATESNIDAINNIFDNLEDRLRDKARLKLDKMKNKLEKVSKKSKRKMEEQKEDAEEDYSDGLKFKNKKQKPIIDEPMDERVDDEKSDDEETNILRLNSLANSISDAVSKSQNKEAEIDPNKYINVKPQHLMTELPNAVTKGDEVLDDSEDDEDERNHAIISEAFADDDVVEEFSKEKEEEIKKSQPQDIDLTMPGWGSWGGKDLKVSRRKKKRFILKFPKEQERKDENKGNVIIIEHNDEKMKEHQVAELPYPFTSVKDFEASIRAPLGRNFVPENAHKRLIEPAVKTAMGQIIEPMGEEVLFRKKKWKTNALPQGNERKDGKFQGKTFGNNKFPNRKFGNSNFPNKKFDNRKFHGDKFQRGKFADSKPQGGTLKN